jgi:hypothetical protein
MALLVRAKTLKKVVAVEKELTRASGSLSPEESASA